MVYALIKILLWLIENVKEVSLKHLIIFISVFMRFVSQKVNAILFCFFCNRLSLWSTVCSSGMLVTDPSPNSSPENRPQTQSQQFLGKNTNKFNYFSYLKQLFGNQLVNFQGLDFYSEGYSMSD